MVFRRKYRFILILLLKIILATSVYYPKYAQPTTTTSHVKTTKPIISEVSNLYKGVNLVDLQNETEENFNCMKTKHLLGTYQTTICLHDQKDAISNIIVKDKIWEEKYLTRLFKFLIRYPKMDFIDVGANLGAYTMFVASLGRLVVAIECFKPNTDRIRKAIQMETLHNQVTLINNAIYSDSNYYLKMQSDPYNIGSQGILAHAVTNQSSNDPYVVRTIRFDDILPIIKEKNIRNAVMKVDIQWSEIYLCMAGAEMFEYVNFPVVLMEWDLGGKTRYEGNMRYILKFFFDRGYVATEDMCKVLNENDALNSWPPDIYWMKTNSSDICKS